MANSEQQLKEKIALKSNILFQNLNSPNKITEYKINSAENLDADVVFTSEWVFLFFPQDFLSDSTPQTSLGEERWLVVAQETGIDYQLEANRKHHTLVFTDQQFRTKN